MSEILSATVCEPERPVGGIDYHFRELGDNGPLHEFNHRLHNILHQIRGPMPDDLIPHNEEVISEKKKRPNALIARAEDALQERNYLYNQIHLQLVELTQLVGAE